MGQSNRTKEGKRFYELNSHVVFRLVLPFGRSVQRFVSELLRLYTAVPLIGFFLFIMVGSKIVGYVIKNTRSLQEEELAVDAKKKSSSVRASAFSTTIYTLITRAYTLVQARCLMILYS